MQVTRSARTSIVFVFLSAALPAGALLTGACRALDPFEHLPEESLPEAGAVVSQHRLATEVGLRILREEFELAMALCGCTSVDEIDGSLLA